MIVPPCCFSPFSKIDGMMEIVTLEKTSCGLDTNANKNAKFESKSSLVILNYSLVFVLQTTCELYNSLSVAFAL